MSSLREAAQMALPCPFCGSEKISVEEGSTFRWVFAMCDACGAQAGEVRKQTIGAGTSEEWEADANRRAIAEWNTRAALVQPERKWQGLTDSDYEAMAEKYVTNCYFDTLKYARAIEARLCEKNS